MMVAKTDQAHIGLTRQFKDRRVCKGYVALVVGNMGTSKGIINAPIGRDTRHRKRMGIVNTGRTATTRFSLLKHMGFFSLVEIFPETGRTHQIRVHFSSIGHPLAGDTLYGASDYNLGRHFLHAHFLRFLHPWTKEYMEFTSLLPTELEDFLEGLS